MTRQYGVEFVERPLMSTISDLLSIPHFTTSNGGTVRKDFLLAVAHGLAIPIPESVTKDGLIRLIWETANRRHMPDELLSRGGTVTNDVLQGVVDALIKADFESGAPASDSDQEYFLEAQDERKRVVREAAIREGQDSFRTKVLDAYRATCTVTGADVPAALEAAHIAPYRGRHSNTVTNGLCLRRDIHALFDRGLLAIDEDKYQVLLSPALRASGAYALLEGCEIKLPREVGSYPNVDALRAHRLWAELEKV